MNTFSLTINLGSEGMRDRVDIAHALRLLADRIHFIEGTEGPIVDDQTGETVGAWQMELAIFATKAESVQ